MGALFGGRSDSTVHLRTEDCGVSPSHVWLRLADKGKRGQNWRRVIRLSRRRATGSAGPSLVDRVATLLDRYVRARKASMASSSAPNPEFLFQLPAEPRRPLTRSMGAWLAASLDRVGIAAPPGFAYLGHSIRSMAVSAMAAIGVPRHVYIWICGWARGSTVVDKHYLDPTFPASPAAIALYGWLRDGHFTAEPLEAAPHRPLADPREQDLADAEAREAAPDVD